MPPVDALENRMLSALGTILGTIDGNPANWLTKPTIAEGDPMDAIPSAGAPNIYYHLAVNEPIPENNSSLRRHGMRVSFAIWIFGSDDREMQKAAGDVRRAIFAGESPAVTAFGAMFNLGTFDRRPEFRQAGRSAGLYVVSADVSVDHQDVN